MTLQIAKSLSNLDNDFAIKWKYHHDLCYLVLIAHLEITRCYYSEYVLCFTTV